MDSDEFCEDAQDNYIGHCLGAFTFHSKHSIYC